MNVARRRSGSHFFFFNGTAPTEIYTLSLHDALPILDAFQASKKPVLITHANCRALNPNHPRCKTDEAIKAMAAKGGVMGITEVRMFVSPTEPTRSEEHTSELQSRLHLVCRLLLEQTNQPSTRAAQCRSCCPGRTRLKYCTFPVSRDAPRCSGTPGRTRRPRQTHQQYAAARWRRLA